MTTPSSAQTTPRVDAGQVLSSARWLAVGQVATQLARLVVSVIMARLLAPADFGLLTMAGVFMQLGWMFTTLGTGPAIIQRPELSESLLRCVTTVAVGMGVLLTFMLMAAAGPIAGFYGEARVTWIVVVLSSAFLLSSFGVVPEGLLQRELKFGRLVAIDLAQLVIASLLSVGLALAGWGVWALVVGNLTGLTFRSVALVASSPWRLRLGFERAGVQELIGFSSGVMGFNLLLYAAKNADRMVVGRFLGAVELGFYDYGFRFYMFPLDVITVVILRLMFPTFSRLQTDKQQLARAFLRTNGAIALVTFPMMMGLAVVADPFVRVVLSDKWAPIIAIIQILAPVAMLHSLGSTTGQLLLACGRAGLRFWWIVFYSSNIVIAVLLGVRWGIRGVAVAYAIAMLPNVLSGFWLALRLVDLRLGAIWRILRSTVAATATMSVLVTAVRMGLEFAGESRSVVLIAAVATGIATYVLMIRWLAPQALNDLYRFLPGPARSHRLIAWLFGPAHRLHTAAATRVP